MKTYFINIKLCAISSLILLASCNNSTKNNKPIILHSYEQAVKEYFKNQLHYSLSTKVQFFLITSAGCNNCIHPYLKIIKEKNKNCKLICHPEFYLGLKNDSLFKTEDIIIDSSKFMNTQTFMRSEICLVKTENKEVVKVEIITKNNVQ
jgi:hypothetical protein